MSCFYHVTSQKATAVSHAFTCSFTGPNDLNLIVGKLFYFEVYLVTPEGLRLIKELPINGRISAAINFKRNGKKQDSIIVVTEKADAAIIDCIKRNDDIYDFVTYANGNIGDNCSISSDGKHEIIVDPTCQIVLFKFFDGVFKAVLMKDLRDYDGEGNAQALNVVAFRVEDGNIKGIFSLYGSSDCATIGLFVEDNKVLNMKSFKMSFSQVDVIPDEWKIDALPPDTQFIIPVEPPYCGILIVGNKNVCYYNKQGVQIPTDIPLNRASTIVCYEKIDVHKYLLGDIMGQLFMMYLFHDGPGTSSTMQPNRLRVVPIGEVSIPETMTYIDNGVVFIGSHLGDSLLIQLSNNVTVTSEDGSLHTQTDFLGSSTRSDAIGEVSVHVLQTYTNVGPIIDIELMEVNGQNQLLLCSGAYKEGSIKIVRNGIGIHELMIMDQSSVKEIWCLELNDSNRRLPHLLAMSWGSRTGFMQIQDDDLTQIEVPGLERENYSILIQAVCGGRYILQVTSREARLVSIQSSSLPPTIHVWTPTDNVLQLITRAAYLDNQLVLVSGFNLFWLAINQDGSFKQKGSTQLSSDVSCLCLSTLLPNVVALTFWMSESLVLLDLTTMKPLVSAELNTTGILARSLLILQFQPRTLPYLMVGMDNGNLIYFQIDLTALQNNDFQNILIEQRRVTIGTGPYMKLELWHSLGPSQGACVFVCSNHPSIIHCSDGRLLFSSINLKNDVVAMSPLNSARFRNCLVLASETNIIFGSIDKIQKLHVRSVPIGESVRRMAIQRETDTLGVLTMRFDTYVDGVFHPLRPSITSQPRVSKSVSAPPDITKRTIIRKLRDVESSHLVLLSQTTLEPVHVHSFYCHDEDVVEQAVSITTMRLPISIADQKLVSLDSIPGTANTSCADLHNVSTISLVDDPMIGGTSVAASVPTDAVKFVPVFIVGTCYITDDEHEPAYGALYVFYYNERSGHCSLLKTVRVYGTPFALHEFDQNRLLVTINSSVQLVDLTKQPDLHVICRYDDMIIALYIKRKDDFILVGDLMRSVTLLRYKPNVAHFELIAQHRAPHWTTAIEFVDDDKLLVAESEMNVFVVSRDYEMMTNPLVSVTPAAPVSAVQADGATGSNSTATTASTATAAATVSGSAVTNKDERYRLTEYASMHTGLVINKFISGNILMQPLLDEYSIKLKNSILYGSTTGAIGQVFEINQTLYTFLKAVESQMQNQLVPVGNFSHETWRSFVKIRQCKVAERFIDGDLVENFQNLDLKDQLKIVKDLQIPVDFAKEVAGFKECNVEDLSRIIEELSRFH